MTAGEALPHIAAESDLRQQYSQLRRRRLRFQRGPLRLLAGSRRRRWQIVGTIGALLLLAASVFTAYSPLMGLQKLDVYGNSRISTDEIVEVFKDQMGRPLATINGDSIRSRLQKFPAIESFSVEARPPDTLLLRLHERTPMAVIQKPGGYHVVDSSGVTLETSETLPAGYPVMEVTASEDKYADTIRALGTLLLQLPESLKKRVSRITAGSPGSINLFLDDNRLNIFWGDDKRTPFKARVAEVLLSLPSNSGRGHFNVSAPEVPTAS